ncbi:MAG: SAM-dependent chlorinase/fluorinase [Chloroflexi bacterium]|nr:SAM-dependent chlorinase/fluorinase [Chloroflexota bacterium]
MTAPESRPPLITLLTDFGLADPYVGVMKGVMLGINPRIVAVDLTHQVAPQNVLEGAFQLGAAWRFFPRGTIHVAVVDPGVGTQRNALAVQYGGHAFLCPDNGLLSFVLPPPSPPPALLHVVGRDGAWLPRPLRRWSRRKPALTFAPYQQATPPGVRAYALSNPRYWRPQVSSTFHGRDVFAPAAAHLSLGVPVEELGEPVDRLVRLHIPEPRREGGRLVGCVLHIDRFGDIVTSIPAEALADFGEGVRVELAGRRIQGLAQSYAAGRGLVALVGSHGYLEIALANGDAARELGVRVGEEVEVGDA